MIGGIWTGLLGNNLEQEAEKEEENDWTSLMG